MEHTLPQLPDAQDAWAPHISRETTIAVRANEIHPRDLNHQFADQLV